MKKTILLLALLAGILQSNYGQTPADENEKTYGILFMAGGRYDDLRMCAASPAGTKGGSIADIMFVARRQLTNRYALALNLPVMRPILFGLAFNMLQFEPEISLEYRKPINEKTDWVNTGGFGVSFHYGPGYQSSISDPGESFFAMGPIFSFQSGIGFNKQSEPKGLLGLRIFYIPLFSKDRDPGTVLGGTLQYTYYF